MVLLKGDFKVINLNNICYWKYKDNKNYGVYTE